MKYCLYSADHIPEEILFVFVFIADHISNEILFVFVFFPDHISDEILFVFVSSADHIPNEILFVFVWACVCMCLYLYGQFRNVGKIHSDKRALVLANEPIKKLPRFT